MTVEFTDEDGVPILATNRMTVELLTLRFAEKIMTQTHRQKTFNSSNTQFSLFKIIFVLKIGITNTIFFTYFF